MSDIQEKKDVVFVKLSKVQQKKLSIQEKIDYLKKESEQVLLDAKKHQSKLKEEQDKLLKVVKSQERKDDTRRKILLGSWVLNKIKHDESFKNQLSDFEQFLNTENKTKQNRIDRKIKICLKIFYEMTIFNDLSIPGQVLVLRSLKMGII